MDIEIHHIINYVILVIQSIIIITNSYNTLACIV